LNTDPDVYNYERLHSLNGGLSHCEKCIVDVVVMKGADALEKRLQELGEGTAGQKSAQYADIVLADFVRHGILDGFREVETAMQAAYESFAEAHKKREDARLTAEEATRAWEVPAEDLRLKLELLRKWANSVVLARAHRLLGIEPSPFSSKTVVGTSGWLKTPGDFVKYHNYILHEIEFIREMSEYEVTEGRLDRPVRMSDFETSLKVFEAAQAHVEARQGEEADAAAALESAWNKYYEERNKAIAMMHPLPEAGRWALFRLVGLDTESPKPGNF
jgi:hypothetical protein